jgi:hypothetical protein
MNWMKNKPWLFCPQAVSLKLVPEGTEVGSMPFYVLKSAFVNNPDVSPINPFVRKGRQPTLHLTTTKHINYLEFAAPSYLTFPSASLFTTPGFNVLTPDLIRASRAIATASNSAAFEFTSIVNT